MNNLKTLLDKIYELEGLVHLAIEREDRKNDLIRLISVKGGEVGRICDEFSNYMTKDVNSNSSDFDLSAHEVYSLDDNENDEEEESFPSNIRRRQRGKLVFTINERFRFKRELFENSDADFNNTLAVLASMENYDEAEEYFISEEGFNMGNPVVREFMDVIKKYFK